MKHFFKLILLFYSTVVLSQTVPAIQWQKSLGGNNGGDHAYSLVKTTDGGYIVAGSCSSNNGIVTGNHGSSDFWIVKLTATGTLQWQKSLGGTGIDEARSIIQTTDGGYIIAGYSTSNNGDVTGNHGAKDYWVVKITSTGTIQWQKSLGGTGNEQAFSIIQATDGGYIVAGYSMSNNGDVTGNHGDKDYWIVKLASTGTIQWQKSLGGTGSDQAHSIVQTTDGGYIVAGLTTSNNGDVTGNHGSGDCCVVKLTSTGDIQWQKALGGTNNDEAYSIIQTTDGGYIFAGYSDSNNGDVTGNHGGGDYWIVKLTSTGNIQWQKALGGTRLDESYSIIQTIDGGYIVAGNSDSNDEDVSGNHEGSDYWVVKLTSVGNIQWQKSLGGSEWDYAYSIIQSTDGGYVIAGYANSNDGDVTGNTGDDYWIVKLASDTLETNTFNENNFVIYPNPVNNILNIDGTAIKSIIITDVTGKTVLINYESILSQKHSKNEINISNLQNGVYFVKIQGVNDNTIIQKIIKI